MQIVMSIACPQLHQSDPLVDDGGYFPPSPLSSFQCTFSLAGFGTGGSKDSGCVLDFFDRYLLYCSNLLGTPQSLMAWHGEGKACLRSSCLLLCCHLPLCPIRPQIRRFFNESHNSGYWAIWDSLSSPSFHQT